MLVERAEMLIKPGAEELFATVMAEEGLPLLGAVAGAKTITFGRGVENPEKFMLLIEWETMDAHVAFTKHESFSRFRALFASYTAGGSMEHFTMI